jgi:hypothetical protein
MTHTSVEGLIEGVSSNASSKEHLPRVLAILSIASMIWPLPVLRAQSQTGQPVIITFGQPNIWSLEQAHYLLARMRSQALKLQSKEFGPAISIQTRLTALAGRFEDSLGNRSRLQSGYGFQNDQARRKLTFKPGSPTHTSRATRRASGRTAHRQRSTRHPARRTRADERIENDD